MTKERVVGVTFVEQKPIVELVGETVAPEESEFGVIEFHTQALLVPEPTNEYDPTAVAVVVSTKSGEAHRVGYLARNSEIKSTMTGITPMELTIFGYSTIGLSDSYVLTY